MTCEKIKFDSNGVAVIKENRKIVAKIYNRAVFHEKSKVQFNSKYPFNLYFVKMGMSRECQTIEEVIYYLEKYTSFEMPF